MTVRPDADRCPGLLRTFTADDGAIVRVRLPGGRLPVSALTRLMNAAVADGAPFVQLTSRANLQIRGLAEPLADEFVTAATEAGFLPHPTHERVRNLIASPWSTHPDEPAQLVAELDATLCADPELARLPGRWLMVVDDGSRHLLGLPYDVAYQRLSADDGLLLIAGSRSRPVSRATAIGEIVRLARSFVELRESLSPSTVWNVADLPADSPLFTGFTDPAPTPVREPDAGPHGRDLVVTVPLGLLTVDQVEALADVSDEVSLTPWRRFVLAGAAGSPQVSERLAAAGLVVTPDSGWDDLTACIGAPYCRRTTVPTLRLATEVAGQVRGVRAHLSGCERRCGRPSTPHVEVVAPVSAQQAIDVLRSSGGQIDPSPHAPVV